MMAARAAIVSLFNVSDAISDAEVALRLRSQYGEVRRVGPHPSMRGCRLVEFYDLRVAAAVSAQSSSHPAAEQNVHPVLSFFCLVARTVWGRTRHA